MPVFPDPRLVDLLRQQNAGMPPWEAFKWFDTPVETLVALAAPPAWTKVAAHNVRRVGIYFALPGAANVQVSTKQGVAGTGFLLTSAVNPLIFRHQADGVLTQVEWYAQPSPGTSLSVIEVLLRAWPGGDPVG